MDELVMKMREEFPTLKRAKKDDLYNMIFFCLGVFHSFQERGLYVTDYFEDSIWKEVIQACYFEDEKK